MGWFGTSTSNNPTTSSTSSKAPPAQASEDGGFIAPDRSARAVCWEARDGFFACLDRAEIIDSVREDAKARAGCAAELLAFERACASSWVTYFKKRRVMEYQRDLTIKKLEADGAKPLDGSSGSAGLASSALKGR